MITVMFAPRSSEEGSGWVCQQEAMSEIMMGEDDVAKRGIEKDPGRQALRDLHDAVYKRVNDINRETAVVVGGDFNMSWGEEGGGPFGSMKGMAEALHLKNVMMEKHGKQGKMPWTFATAETTIDHMLVSEPLMTSVRAAPLSS